MATLNPTRQLVSLAACCGLSCLLAGLTTPPAMAALTEVRSIDGTGNNVLNPTWGSAGTPLLRMSPADFPGDGSGATMIEEPARAIARNAIVIALGFTPLFFAPLVPYITVGAFMASIMAISGAATLLLLPAVSRWALREPRPEPMEAEEH